MTKKMQKIITLVTLLAASSAYIYAEPVEVIPPENKTLSSGNNRFVYGQISQNKIDQYMLDTHTGRLWRIVRAEDDLGELDVKLQPVRYIAALGHDLYTPEPESEMEAYHRMKAAKRSADLDN